MARQGHFRWGSLKHFSSETTNGVVRSLKAFINWRANFNIIICGKTRIGLNKRVWISNFILFFSWRTWFFCPWITLSQLGLFLLLPLLSPYMKSLKLDDQFFIKIYIFVQKRHTYVIMAKSKVTGMYILLLMFQQHCYYTIQIFIVTKPLNLFKQLVTAMGLFPFLLL